MVGLVILAGIAVAVLGVYLLIAGAVALVGWLVAVAARREATRQTLQLVPAAEPSAAAPPENPYHVVLPIEPGVFDEPQRLEAAATDVFCGWARQLPKVPRDPREALRGLSLRRRLIGRLTTKLDGRRLAWRAAPYGGRERAMGGRPIDLAGLDPYHPRATSGRGAATWSCAGGAAAMAAPSTRRAAAPPASRAAPVPAPARSRA